MDLSISKYFQTPFLSNFTLTSSILPFTDQELTKIDHELSEYERIYLDPDIEKHLYRRNELMASFAISKAENSELTLVEAQKVYDLVLENEELSFLKEKINKQQPLSQKEFEKLEFYNIVNVFRHVNKPSFNIDDLTPKFIRNIHAQLTAGFDIFHQYIIGFTTYKSGMWRDNDEIIVGSYTPAPYWEIESGVVELIDFIRKNYSVTSIGVFHTALYALHPFNNGNKRVCRVLEHLLLKGLGLNPKNLYSTSFYYHKEKNRYYKYLLASLERKNLTHFVAFFQEALFISAVTTVKTSLEIKRAEFLYRQEPTDQLKLIAKPLLKRKEMQYKNLRKLVVGKMAEQTFVTNLQLGVEKQILAKREEGRSVYYCLKFTSKEEQIISRWLEIGKKKLTYIPDSIRLV